MDPAFLVGTGGAIGAVARYLVSESLPADRFPWATLVVNVVGSFALGLVVFGGVGGDAALLVGTGACGSFTTFSSFSVAAVRLWESGERRLAAAHAVGNFVSCALAVGIAAAVVVAVL